MTRVRQRFHRDQDFDRTRPGNQPLRVQYTAPVHYWNIRGKYSLSIQLEAPAVVWDNGRRWAFLHDFDDSSLLRLMDEYRSAAEDRRDPHGRGAR